MASVLGIHIDTYKMYLVLGGSRVAGDLSVAESRALQGQQPWARKALQPSGRRRRLI